MPEPGLFVGSLRHRRFAPRAHAFTYPIFMTLLDIDRITEQMSVSPFTSHNRFNWASFHDGDYLGPERRTVREKLEDDARRSGIRLPAGQVLLLTHLRYLGYVFNPVSFFYCFNERGELACVMAEVHNTYGGRRTYWLTEPVETSQNGSRTYRTTKTLYVSPFIPTDISWTFVFSPIGERVLVHMTAEEPAGTPILDATLRVDRHPWQSRTLHRVLRRFPGMTMAVIARIHWQALRLYLKGVPVIPRMTSNGLPVPTIPKKERT